MSLSRCSTDGLVVRRVGGGERWIGISILCIDVIGSSVDALNPDGITWYRRVSPTPRVTPLPLRRVQAQLALDTICVSNCDRRRRIGDVVKVQENLHGLCATVRVCRITGSIHQRHSPRALTR